MAFKSNYTKAGFTIFTQTAGWSENSLLQVGAVSYQYNNIIGGCYAGTGVIGESKLQYQQNELNKYTPFFSLPFSLHIGTVFARVLFLNQSLLL